MPYMIVVSLETSDDPFISYFCPRHLQVAQLAWASEPIVFGSAFVSIYGRASSCALFLADRNMENFRLSHMKYSSKRSDFLRFYLYLFHVIDDFACR